MLGGQVVSKVGTGAASALLVVPGLELTQRHSAEFALGAILSSYKFDRYKTKKEGDEEGGEVALSICCEDAPEAAALDAVTATADGVALARDLVNEPPNVLYPEEFARRCEALRELGVEVEVLDKARLEAVGMRTLLAVNQGSVREPRVVIMRWHGAKKKEAAPLAFVGKGVCFDTGGISIKPASGMEEMKGDMGGAAAVTGLMRLLAARKAKVNVVGAIGLVENMPDGAAQRPGDIVTSLSGQTIEIINTDAEGRLVLADVIWHVRETFKPRFVVDLATLTGAIIVALGQEHAGLYCNDDELAARLIAAGEATGETVWRMPIGKAYDKMLDSKFADMKNVGGRQGGSSSAAMFIKRFVGDTPWAHLDIAGTAMGSKENDINHSWGSGWGVRLLDRLVSDHYEE
jgi:leucyl aminopeptidase